MVRWRFCLVLAVMLMLPLKISSKNEDDEDDERGEEGEEEEEDDDDDEDDGERGQGIGGEGSTVSGRRAPILATPKGLGLALTRTTKKHPPECYVCAYKSETPLRACLDPTKFRVHTITCHSVDEMCFTSVISKGDSYEAVVRGCRTGCVGTHETTCCEINRCNNQAFAMPLIQPRAAHAENGSNKPNKCIPPLFFITVLLVLQTVVKVTIV